MKILGESSIGQKALKQMIEKQGHKEISEKTGISVCRLYEIASGRKEPIKMSLYIAKKLYDNLEIEPFSWFISSENI